MNTPERLTQWWAVRVRSTRTFVQAHSSVLAIGFVAMSVLLIVWARFGFTLEVGRFFAAEPVSSPAADTTTDRSVVGSRTQVPPECTVQDIQCIQAPCNPIITCSRVACIADRRSVPVGTSVTVRAYGGTDGYAFNAPDAHIAMYDTTGNEGPTNEIVVNYDAPGTKQILVTAKRTTDPLQVDVATCAVTVLPAAVTN